MPVTGTAVRTSAPGGERLPDHVLDVLHRRFARDRDPGDRDRLVLAYRPFARHLAGHFRDRGEPLEDLQQVAMMAIIKALDRFDPERGIRFSTFASRYVSGELKRHFRDKTWAVRVPRAIQERYLAMKAIVEVLRGELGRSPTIPELAERLDVSDEDVLEAMEAAALYRIRSLDDSRGSDDERSDEAATAEPGFDAVERQVLGEQVLGSVLQRISERERELLHLYYVDGLSQAEIASRVGTSQVSVSRHLSRTIDRLRALARL
ncbi:MAG TPA: sigma-70 family RNA polymerase sigma factor [Acidimicrobiales bacterium]|nr:sigma-70 family RNA polymerase sigma factor [Acidimicrobiales bacterium]